MPSEEAHYQRTLAEKIPRRYLDVILIHQREIRRSVADLQCASFNSC